MIYPGFMSSSNIVSEAPPLPPGTDFFAGDGTAGTVDGIGTDARFESMRHAALDTLNNVVYIYENSNPDILASGGSLRRLDVDTAAVTTITRPSSSRIVAMCCCQNYLYVVYGDGFGVSSANLDRYNVLTGTWEENYLALPSTYASGDVKLTSTETDIYFQFGNYSTLEIYSSAVTSGTPAALSLLSTSTPGAVRYGGLAYSSGFMYIAPYASSGGYFASGLTSVNTATGVVTALTDTSAAAPVDGFGLSATFVATSGVATDGTYVWIRDRETLRQYNISTTEVTTILGVNNDPGEIEGDFTTTRIPRQRYSSSNAFPGDILYNPNDGYLYMICNNRVRRVSLG